MFMVFVVGKGFWSGQRTLGGFPWLCASPVSAKMFEQRDDVDKVLAEIRSQTNEQAIVYRVDFVEVP